jgi:hypothetical protein
VLVGGVCKPRFFVASNLLEEKSHVETLRRLVPELQGQRRQFFMQRVRRKGVRNRQKIRVGGQPTAWVPHPRIFEGEDFSSQLPIDNPVTTLLHYSRKVVRLAFRETPLTTQI